MKISTTRHGKMWRERGVMITIILDGKEGITSWKTRSVNINILHTTIRMVVVVVGKATVQVEKAAIAVAVVVVVVVDCCVIATAFPLTLLVWVLVVGVRVIM